MAYLIIKIDYAEDRRLSEHDPARRPYIAQFSLRHALREPEHRHVREVLLKRGYELPMTFNATMRDWPLHVIYYISKRKDGVGRSGSSLYRRLARVKT